MDFFYLTILNVSISSDSDFQCGISQKSLVTIDDFNDLVEQFDTGIILFFTEYLSFASTLFHSELRSK